MKKSAFFLLLLLCACSISPRSATGTATPSTESFQQTKLYALTEEAVTQTAARPANDATLTAVIETKSAAGTAAAATMAAQPTQTGLPTVSPNLPDCQPQDLQVTFASNAATQQILLGVGLKNVGPGACALPAWPQVTLVDLQGKPLDVTYYYSGAGVNGASTATQIAQDPAIPSARIELPAGQTAWVNLAWQNWCKAAVPGGAVIHLTLPADAGTIVLLTNIGAGGPCNAPGYPSTVGIMRTEVADPG